MSSSLVVSYVRSLPRAGDRRSKNLSGGLRWVRIELCNNPQPATTYFGRTDSRTFLWMAGSRRPARPRCWRPGTKWPPISSPSSGYVFSAFIPQITSVYGWVLDTAGCLGDELAAQGRQVTLLRPRPIQQPPSSHASGRAVTPPGDESGGAIWKQPTQMAGSGHIVPIPSHANKSAPTPLLWWPPPHP